MILFRFALFSHLSPMNIGLGGGAGGCSLPIISLSTLLLVINRFLSVEDVN